MSGATNDFMKTKTRKKNQDGSTTRRMMRRLIAAWVLAFLAGFLPPVLMWIQFSAGLLMLSLAYKDLKAGMSLNDQAER